MEREIVIEGDINGHYTKRYVVRGENGCGTYGVHFAPGNRPYGGSRDVHQIVPQDYKRSEYDSIEPRNDCEFNPGQWSRCDGSSLVEVITDDDEAAFKIAEGMCP